MGDTRRRVSTDRCLVYFVRRSPTTYLVRVLIEMIVKGKATSTILASRAAADLGVARLADPLQDDNESRLSVLKEYAKYALPLHEAIIESPHYREITDDIDTEYWK